MNIVVYGATSAIVKEHRHYATEGHNFFLVARNEEKLEIVKKDLKKRCKLCKRIYLRSYEA